MRLNSTIWAIIGLTGAAFSLHAVGDDPALAREARAILSDTCFVCHGPDATARKADLRLDSGGGIASVVNHEDPNASEILARITADDTNDVMPPPDSGLSLSDVDRATLVKWIHAGAPVVGHWSFEPIIAAAPPIDPNHPNLQPIDAFVRDRLKREALEPSPPAAKESLIRRIYFDLTGLPPSVEEIDAFVNDTSPDAIDRIVEKCLASSAYGERMTVDWLDAARYADTFGYQADVANEVWPWRDWVIRAFNDNMPYDEFIRQQIAGDLIPNATPDTILATAFNRLHRQTNEGGSINEEWRVEYVADRTQTFGTAFLGMTFECARCHTHKFDPVSQEEFYELFAFFDDIDESGLYSHFTRSTPTPYLDLYPGDAARAKHNELKEAVADAEANADQVAEEARARFEEWFATDPGTTPAQPQTLYSFDSIEENKVKNAAGDTMFGQIEGGPEQVDGVVGKALKFSGENRFTTQEAANFERTDPFTFACWINPGVDKDHMVVFHRCRAESDAASRGYELMLENFHPAFSLIHFWPGDAIRVESSATLTPGEWAHVAVTYDGSSRADGLNIYVNGEPTDLRVIRDKLRRMIRYTDTGENPPFTIAERFRDFGFKNGLVDEMRIYDREISAMQVKAIVTAVKPDPAAETLDDRPSKEAIFDHYLLAVDEPYREAREKLHKARKAEDEFINKIPRIMVMKDMEEPRQAYLLNRGHYADRTDPVTPDTPASILPFGEERPHNRLGLAEWLVDKDTPLTARVAVNRYWQIFFGRGLVRTQEDFGNQGTPPSHPELLDYLAAEFMASGWDVKALCKRIVMSQTYQQSSLASPELLNRDPENTLLARGPRHRLNAEQIRDAALAASGLLVDKIGGPSVHPYQPDGLWKESGSLTYKADEGDGLYRRSMYTFMKRTVPPPYMVTFDAPGREVCRVRRERTATPLQALTLLNDPQFVEAARVMAERTIAAHETGVPAIEYMFRALTSRRPSDRETTVLNAIYAEQLEIFKANPDGAKQYIATGEKPNDDTLDPVQAAAHTAVAQAIMNLDDFQTKP